MGDWVWCAWTGGSEEGGEAGGLMLGYQKSTTGPTPLFTLVTTQSKTRNQSQPRPRTEP
jgi:hypothetical protein